METKSSLQSEPSFKFHIDEKDPFDGPNMADMPILHRCLERSASETTSVSTPNRHSRLKLRRLFSSFSSVGSAEVSKPELAHMHSSDLVRAVPVISVSPASFGIETTHGTASTRI